MAKNPKKAVSDPRNRGPRRAKLHATLPKPFVFVLMPFEARFNDTYKYGIKGAADDVGAYAERLDEQIFTEGMLDHIFNQISKADVIVADMTGRNANVFYEVGYAHALGKTVLLVTQDASDIPFDLKHRQHTVYSGQIEKLRTDLVTKLAWAIQQSRLQRKSDRETLSIRVFNTVVREAIDGQDAPTIVGVAQQRTFDVPLFLRNESVEDLLSISRAYLFAASDSVIVPRYDHQSPMTFSTDPTWSTGFSTIHALHQPSAEPLDSFEAHPEDAPDGLSQQFQLPVAFTPVPPRAIERNILKLMLVSADAATNVPLRIRLHSEAQFYDFRFQFSVNIETSISNKSKEKT